MTFIQAEFLWLMTTVFVVYWMLPSRWAQNVLLLIASAVFYGWVHPWFLVLLYVASVLDYLISIQIEDRPRHRKLWLVLSLVGNLGLLGYFKYCDFFIESFITAFAALGIQTSLHTLGIFLPVGISFYTFQTMSYTIDVYRGDLAARRNFLNYIVFVGFFPQLVAGPVERASNLLPQMERERVFDIQQIRSGFFLALWGASKKICVADTVSPYVDRIFAVHEPSAAMILAATLGFTVQILADFSGYTDIARGTARMLGVELMKNFDHPYMARNPSEFWRRWHISFSTWIRDYLFIPLGGSRGTFAQTTRATFGAMLLSGLWHGASWTFVIWGAYHACLITGYRLLAPLLPRAWRKSLPGQAGAVALMFCFTVLGWLIFRETRIDRLIHYLSLPLLGGTEAQWLAAGIMLAVTLLCAAPLVVALVIEEAVLPRLRHSDWYLPIQATAGAAFVVAMLVFLRSTTSDFIYFQF